MLLFSQTTYVGPPKTLNWLEFQDKMMSKGSCNEEDLTASNMMSDVAPISTVPACKSPSHTSKSPRHTSKSPSHASKSPSHTSKSPSHASVIDFTVLVNGKGGSCPSTPEKAAKLKVVTPQTAPAKMKGQKSTQGMQHSMLTKVLLTFSSMLGNMRSYLCDLHIYVPYFDRHTKRKRDSQEHR